MTSTLTRPDERTDTGLDFEPVCDAYLPGPCTAAARWVLRLVLLPQCGHLRPVVLLCDRHAHPYTTGPDMWECLLCRGVVLIKSVVPL